MQLSFHGLRLQVREANHNNFCSCFMKHDFCHFQTALGASEAAELAYFVVKMLEVVIVNFSVVTKEVIYSMLEGA